MFDPHHRTGPGVEFDELERPVVGVDWYMATLFCRWLGAEYQLPIEAQWESACRANGPGPNVRETEYWFGDNEEQLARHAWYGNFDGRGNAEERTYSLRESQQAGGHENPWGLFDMHGNVDEWCQDARAEYAQFRDRVTDPVVRAENLGDGPRNPQRVARGGSWIDSAGYGRCAYRFWRWPDYRLGFQGFRVCLVPGLVAVPQLPGGAGPPEAGSASGGR